MCLIDWFQFDIINEIKKLYKLKKICFVLKCFLFKYINNKINLMLTVYILKKNVYNYWLIFY